MSFASFHVLEQRVVDLLYAIQRGGERQVLQRRYPQRGHKPRLLRHAMWPEAAVFARINTTTASDTHCYRGN